MNQNNITTSPITPLESVVRQFEHWRETRGKRGRIPEALWALVPPLMEQYGHNEIASALRINHAQLKQRALYPLSANQQKPALFVECPLPLPVSSTGNCLIEFTAKMALP